MIKRWLKLMAVMIVYVVWVGGSIALFLAAMPTGRFGLAAIGVLGVLTFIATFTVIAERNIR